MRFRNVSQNTLSDIIDQCVKCVECVMEKFPFKLWLILFLSLFWIWTNTISVWYHACFTSCLLNHVKPWAHHPAQIWPHNKIEEKVPCKYIENFFYTAFFSGSSSSCKVKIISWNFPLFCTALMGKPKRLKLDRSDGTSERWCWEIP